MTQEGPTPAYARLDLHWFGPYGNCHHVWNAQIWDVSWFRRLSFPFEPLGCGWKTRAIAATSCLFEFDVLPQQPLKTKPVTHFCDCPPAGMMQLIWISYYQHSRWCQLKLLILRKATAKHVISLMTPLTPLNREFSQYRQLRLHQLYIPSPQQLRFIWKQAEGTFVACSCQH